MEKAQFTLESAAPSSVQVGFRTRLEPRSFFLEGGGAIVIWNLIINDLKNVNDDYR